MGYSTNPAVLESRRPALAELEAGRACRWTLPTQDPTLTRRRANEIREALYIAKLHRAEYPDLAAAADTFSIHIVGPGVIEARPKQGRDALLTPDTLVPQHGTQTWGSQAPSVGVSTAEEVIDAWRLHLPSNDPVHFPQSTLSISELRRVYAWATTSTPRLMLLVGDGFLTISLREAGTEPYAWVPPVEPAIDNPTLR